MSKPNPRAPFAVGISLAFVTGAAALLASSTASAQRSQRNNMEACGSQDLPADSVISACTAIIESRRISSGNLSAAYNNRGFSYYKKGDHDRAIADYGDAIRINPQNIFPYINRGFASISKGDYDQAISDCNQAARINSKYVEAYDCSGEAYRNKGDYDRAIADDSEAIRINPKEGAVSHNNRGLAYAGKGDHDQAIADYIEAIRIDPKYAQAYINKGFSYYKKGDYDRAVADYNEAIQLDPKLVNGYNNRAAAYNDKGDYDRAIIDANEAIRLNPKFANPYRHLGNAYEGKGDLDRAIASFDEAIRINPKYADAYADRGSAYRAKGDVGRATADYKVALAINPSHKDAHAALDAIAAAAPTQTTSTKTDVAVISGKRVALVVGEFNYTNVPRLGNPRNDATLMAYTLRGLGFTLVGDGAQLNLDKPHFDDAVRNFGNQLQGADVALFYYAGHGVQVRGENYLVPVDANPTKESDVDFQMLDANLVLRQMEGSGSKLNLVLLDACRNNPFGGRGLRATDGGLAQMRAPEGTLISFATQPGSVAQDGNEANSPYAKALAQTIKRPGLDIFQVFNRVGLEVMGSTGGNQQPWVSASPIRGTFYFAGPGDISSGATSPAASPSP